MRLFTRKGCVLLWGCWCCGCCVPMSESESSQELHREELVNMAGGRKKSKGCCRRHPVACGVTLLVVACLSLAVLGVAVGIRSYLNETFVHTVDTQVLLVPGTEGTKEFEKSSAPLYTKFYFFNVTNGDKIVGGAKPVVTQVGPYVYREWRTKTNLTWNQNQTVVHYDLNVTYTFEPSMSSGDPAHDKIVTLNIPLYVLLLKVEGYEEGMNQYEKHLVRDAIEDARQNSGEGGLFRTILVRDLLFGYNDSLLVYLINVINALPIPSAKNFSGSINPFFGLENITEVQYGNAVHTGKDDISLIAKFIEWNGNFEIYKHGGWGTPAAKMINGTGGFMFPPDVKKDHNLMVFVSELYRSGYFSFLDEQSLYGIKLYRFILPKEELISANQDPGFYANGPDGVLNLTAVFVENAPVFASKPHFLDADPSYRKNIIGMDPVRDLHDSYLDVEPITGAVMRAAKRIQINLRLEKNPNFVETEKLISPLMMPVFWASEEGSLTKSLANEFKKKVYVAKYGIEGGVWAGVGLGGLVFLMMSLCFVGLVIQQCRYRRRQRSVAINPDEHDPLLN